MIVRDSFLPAHLYSERYGVCVHRGAAALLLQPGEVHTRTRDHEYTDFEVLYIEPTLVARTAREGLSRAPHFRMTQSEDPLLLAAVSEFCAAAAQQSRADELQSSFATCLQRLLEAMDLRPASTHGAYHPVSLAREYLRHRLHETVTLDDLGNVSGLSRFHLLRSFAAKVGLPPHAYQVRLRIERAMTLLRSGLSPSAVAGLVGFADQSHLTRHFRRLMHVTPAQYARATGAG
jgi:AraC-like DNA-binding protein